MPTNCVFCPEMGIATTATTTNMDAFPFLCTQLGMTAASSSLNSRPLCLNCLSIWEEVTLIYSNMQGLINLMGRRVDLLKDKLQLSRQSDSFSATVRQGKRMRPTRRRFDSSQPPTEGPATMMNWWYPSHNLSNPQPEDDVDPINIECRPGFQVKSEPVADDGYTVQEEDEEVDGFSISPEESNTELMEVSNFNTTEQIEVEGCLPDPLAPNSSISESQPSYRDTVKTLLRGKGNTISPDGVNLKAASKSGLENVHYPIPHILNGKYFKAMHRQGVNVAAQCITCMEDPTTHGKISLIKGHVNATSNFRLHLKRKHPDVLAQYVQEMDRKHSAKPKS